MKFARSPSFYILVVVLIVGVGGWFARRQLIKEIAPEIEKVQIAKVNIFNDSAHIHLLLVIKNKGWTSFELKGIEMNISSDTVKLVHYINTTPKTLRKYETRTFEIDFTVPVRAAIKQIRNLQDRDSTQLALKGWMDISTSFGDKRIEIEKLVAVDVPTPPVIGVQELEYLERNDKTKTHDFNIRLKFVNLNKKEFWLSNVSYTFKGEKLVEANGKINGDIRIPPMDSINLVIPFQLKIEKGVSLFFKIIFDNDVIDYDFRMKGTIVSVAGLQQNIEATYDKQGKVELYNPNRKKTKFTIKKKASKKA